MGFPRLQVRRNLSVLKDRENWEQTSWGTGGISAAGRHCRARDKSVRNDIDIMEPPSWQGSGSGCLLILFPGWISVWGSASQREEMLWFARTGLPRSWKQKCRVTVGLWFWGTQKEWNHNEGSKELWLERMRSQWQHVEKNILNFK